MRTKAILSALALLLAPALGAENLFVNGDFEEGNREWSLISTPERLFHQGAVPPKIAEGVSCSRGRRALFYRLKKSECIFVMNPVVYWPFVKGLPFPKEWKFVTLSFAAKVNRVPSEKGQLTFRVIFCGENQKDIPFDVNADFMHLKKDAWSVFEKKIAVPQGYQEARFKFISTQVKEDLEIYADDFYFGPQ